MYTIATNGSIWPATASHRGALFTAIGIFVLCAGQAWGGQAPTATPVPTGTNHARQSSGPTQKHDRLRLLVTYDQNLSPQDASGGTRPSPVENPDLKPGSRDPAASAAVKQQPLAPNAARERESFFESVIPALAYGPLCSSTLNLRNLGDRAVEVEVEGHRASGALVALADNQAVEVRLAARERGTFKLELAEETTGAWVKVREHVPPAGISPVVAVSAFTECTVGNELRTTSRDVAFPMHNPWFSSETADLRDGVMLMINTSGRAARGAVCYSSGDLYSVPEAGRSPELQPICTTFFEIQVPPFGSHEFPVSSGASSHFTLKTKGDAIVLELLRPLKANVRVYSVDSSVRFGEEVKR